MKVVMTNNAKGINQEGGGSTMTYEAGVEYEATEAWQVRVLTGFVKAGKANEIGGNAAPEETKTTRKPRAKKAEVTEEAKATEETETKSED